MKISLCLIVKPTEEEAVLLGRCLKSLLLYVDEICVTLTKGTHTKIGIKSCKAVAKKYGCKVSYFDWVKDFSKARNFNFSQATGDYILWLDSDDVLKGAEHLRETVKEMKKQKIDVGVMNYLYDFNEHGDCTVKHLKTRIIKNDGCVKWTGAVHEDFEENRALDSVMIKDVEVLHITDDMRAHVNAERNLEIAENEKREKGEDPRSDWLMANAKMGLGDTKEAEKHFTTFINKSKSDEEKYLAYINLASIVEDDDRAIDYALQALKLRPSYPNAYHKIAELCHASGKKERALEFIEIGLQMPLPEMTIMVYNPRDYDFNPMMLMMKIYFELGKPTKAMEILNQLIQWYPKDKGLLAKKKILDVELGELLKVDEIIEKAPKNKKKLRKYLDKLPDRVQSHPKICVFRNNNFIKTKTTGKDLVYYCGYTSKVWHPEQTTVGGSEEAVINLAEQWAKDWNVTVYNNCGVEKKYGNVTYKPYWAYNLKDKQDVTILWRHPKPVDFDINSEKVFLDLHDVIPSGEFNKERLGKIDKVFVKTKAHRNLFPNIPDEKIAIIPNGVDVTQFKEMEKDEYLILNTSSPDRHLDATLDVFEELIKRDPDKPWKLAWYYGWGIYDTVHGEDQERMEWKRKVMKRFVKLVKDGRAEGGFMIPQEEIAKKYMKAGVFLYPTQFFEIHCISAVKAQLAGCKMVTSDFAALAETVNNKHNKVHTKGEKWERDNTFGDTNISEYVDRILNNDKTNTSKWAKETYNWELISKTWNNELSN